MRASLSGTHETCEVVKDFERGCVMINVQQKQAMQQHDMST